MPLYEYECEKCSHVFEVTQKFSDPPIEKCERCGGKTKKLISKTSFQLKGGGWYASDYKKSPSPDTTSVPQKEATPDPKKASDPKPSGGEKS